MEHPVAVCSSQLTRLVYGTILHLMGLETITGTETVISERCPRYSYTVDLIRARICTSLKKSPALIIHRDISVNR